MENCFVGIGSNLGNPLSQVRQAIEHLRELPQTGMIAVSSLYQSKPMGPQDQDDFVNAVAWLETDLEPLALLLQLQEIERRQGRQRKAERWGPRSIDLDLLLYAQQQLDLPSLKLPHYGLTQRDFVILPLAEIAPAGLSIPGYGDLGSIQQKFDPSNLKRLGHE